MFWGCSSLTSIIISNSVTSIGNYSFNICPSLTSVTVLNPIPVAITQYVFTNQANATLYVPMGSRNAYLSANYWKEFNKVFETDYSGIDQIKIRENGFSEQRVEERDWYTIDGKQVDKPKKGFSIIRMSDGTVRKVFVK